MLRSASSLVCRRENPDIVSRCRVSFVPAGNCHAAWRIGIVDRFADSFDDGFEISRVLTKVNQARLSGSLNVFELPYGFAFARIRLLKRFEIIDTRPLPPSL